MSFLVHGPIIYEKTFYTQTKLFFYDKVYNKIIISGAATKQRLTWMVVLLRTEQFVYFLD